VTQIEPGIKTMTLITPMADAAYLWFSDFSSAEAGLRIQYYYDWGW